MTGQNGTPHDEGLGISKDVGRILYDERVVAPDGRTVTARLRTDGTMLLGFEESKLRELPFFIDPVTQKPWLPSKPDFVASVSESIANGAYDFDGEDTLCLESFLRSLSHSQGPAPNASPTGCTPSPDTQPGERAAP